METCMWGLFIEHHKKKTRKQSLGFYLLLKWREHQCLHGALKCSRDSTRGTCSACEKCVHYQSIFIQRYRALQWIIYPCFTGKELRVWFGTATVRCWLKHGRGRLNLTHCSHPSGEESSCQEFEQGQSPGQPGKGDKRRKPLKKSPCVQKDWMLCSDLSLEGTGGLWLTKGCWVSLSKKISLP